MSAKRKPRATYREYSEQEVNATIHGAIPEGGVFWDYLVAETMQENFGASEFERGVIEGGRRFANRLIGIAMEFKK